MRNAFAEQLVEMAALEKSVVLLSGDIGNRLFDNYKERYPNRFFNCGVAESNMTSMAAGMAMSGLKPITYTIAPFNTFRCLEQIKIDVCYHSLPIIIVGVGAGLSYAELGGTHHSCEDIAILRSLPNMTVICPCDAFEVKASLKAALYYEKPVYLRLGKKNEPLIHQQMHEFTIGKGIVLSPGKDICLIGTGNIMPIVMEVKKILEEKKFSVQTISMHTIKPLDKDLLSKVFKQSRIVCTIEEHSLIGGLSTAVAEWFVDHSSGQGQFLRIGLEDAFLHGCGNQANARRISGLIPDTIANKILSKIK
jgi:transketolase